MKSNLPKNNFLVVLIPLTIAIVSHILVFLGLYFSWFGVSNGTGGDFCEISHNSLIKQPSNTFSNFGFMLVGLLSSYQIYKGKFANNNNPLTRTIFFPILMTSLMILLSPGSMAMHASETTVGGYFDMITMYLIAAIIFSYSSYRLFKTSKKVYVLIFIGTIVVCHLFHYSNWEPPLVGFAGSFIFGVFCVLGVAFELLYKFINEPQMESKWLLLACFTFIIAFGIWQIGWDEHPWCIPDAIVQAHAVWHILDAVAIYCFFRLYVSENISEKRPAKP